MAIKENHSSSLLPRHFVSINKEGKGVLICSHLPKDWRCWGDAAPVIQLVGLKTTQFIIMVQLLGALHVLGLGRTHQQTDVEVAASQPCLLDLFVEGLVSFFRLRSCRIPTSR